MGPPPDHFGHTRVCDANLSRNCNFTAALSVQADDLFAIAQQQGSARNVGTAKAVASGFAN